MKALFPFFCLLLVLSCQRVDDDDELDYAYAISVVDYAYLDVIDDSTVYYYDADDCLLPRKITHASIKT